MNNRILEDQLCEKIGRDFDEFKFDITCHFKIVNEVNESFPKLISTNMNENISGVKYEISMSYIEEHGEKSKWLKKFIADSRAREHASDSMSIEEAMLAFLQKLFLLLRFYLIFFIKSIALL